MSLRVVVGLLLVVLMGAFSVPALAGPNGTTSGETTANAFEPSGGTLPLSPGELSVRYSASTTSDSFYADTTGNVVTTVDTGFDMTNIDTPDNHPGEITPGDTIVYSFQVRNLGNNAQAVPFTFELQDQGGTESSFTRELFHDSNDDGDFDTGADARADTDVFFAEDETDTIFAVITASDTAQDGDTLGRDLFATNNAPISGDGSNIDNESGDEWQDSEPVGVGVNERDTQFQFFRTSVAAPELTITKTIDSDSSSGSYRPGDTVGYRLTVENLGSDTATSVEIVDAMPDSTTYVANSASIDTGTLDTSRFGDGIGFDDDFGGSFSSTETSPVERINWAIESVGPSGQSNDLASVKFQVTID